MSNKTSANSLEQELEHLKRQYEQLREDKVRTEQNLDKIGRQLTELEEQAIKRYGTSDPHALGKMLEEKKAENAKLVADYREHILSIQEGLQKLEQGEDSQ